MTQAVIALGQLLEMEGTMSVVKHLSQQDFDSVVAMRPGIQVTTMGGGSSFHDRASFMVEDVIVIICSPNRATRERGPVLRVVP